MQTLKVDKFEFLAAPWPMDTKKETLIFIHGAGMNYYTWESQVSNLSTNANVLALNLPGRGSSEEKARKSIGENVDYVLDFINKIQIKRPIICGLSMGGAVVLSLLTRKLENIKAGIVINSGARLRVSTIILDAIQKDYTRYVDSLGQFTLALENNLPETLAKLKKAITKSPATALRDLKACNTFDIMEELHTIDIPVLVLTAADDLITPTKYGEHLKKSIPKATLHCIEHAGHLSPMERPDTVNSHIIRFINDL